MTKTDYTTKARADMQYLYMTDSKIKCDGCKQNLGILYMVGKALFKKQNTQYTVVCKKCGHINIRTKGALKKELNERWQ